MKNQQVPLVCYCGVTFLVSPSHLKYRRSCSRACAALRMSSDDPKHKTVNNQRWRTNNRDKMKAIRRRYLYDITQEECDRRYEEQSGLCCICKQSPATDLDHDHESTKARGLLCGNCNRGLGLLKDDPNVLLSAAEYLNKWRADSLDK